MQERGREHPERRPEEVDPEGREAAAADGGGERPRRVHAHSGDRRLGKDVDRDQGARADAGPTGELRTTHAHYDRHQDERDGDLRGESSAETGSGKRGGEVRGRMLESLAEDRPRQGDFADPAQDLGGPVEKRVVRGNATEAPERQRHRRVQVRAGPLAPRRVGEDDCGEAHRKPHQRPPRGRIDRLGARRRVLQQDREDAGGHHERAEPGGFHRVLGPVCLEGSSRRHGSDSGPCARMPLRSRRDFSW